MKTKLNVKLLRLIQKHITEEPRRFFMSGIRFQAHDKERWRDFAMNCVNDLSLSMPPCGTAACIAGWALLLSDCDAGEGLDTAASLLGIPQMESGHRDYDSLFLDSSWPEPFKSKWKNAKTPKTRAKIACARIDHLIETGK